MKSCRFEVDEAEVEAERHCMGWRRHSMAAGATGVADEERTTNANIPLRL
jgi:hypothetical protein